MATDFYNKQKEVIYMKPEELLISAEGVQEENDERIFLLEALGRLEDKYKRIIILKYFDDLTFRDIAETLDMPESTVKTNLY